MHYFAYGSNLLTARLRERVPGVRVVGPAVLEGWKLCFAKRGYRDGTGKCSVELCSGARVHGVLYDVPDDQRRLLDAAEGLGAGYERAEVEVTVGDGGARPGSHIRAWTYVAQAGHLDPSLPVLDWYRDLVLAGAEEHGLPADYVEGEIRCVTAVPDPDRERDRAHRLLLPRRFPGNISSSDA